MSFFLADGVYNETTLTVYNHMLVSSPTGNVSDINGFAYATEDPGKLRVDLIGGGQDSPCECKLNTILLTYK